ncbi:MAG: hypothetical protein VCF07_16260, partial [Nitrospinota bacterium]
LQPTFSTASAISGHSKFVNLILRGVCLDGEKWAEWSSEHGQLTKIRLPDGCEGGPFQWRRNLSMIGMDLKAIWEMSV